MSRKNKKYNIRAIINSCYFLDGEKYIKERLEKLVSSPYKMQGYLPELEMNEKVRIVVWEDRELEGIVLYLPMTQRPYMTTI